MASGYEENQERLRVISLLGKELVRRSKSKCELCEVSGAKLSAWEVAPIQNPPTADGCIFICEECRNQVENPKRLQPGRWRGLESVVWSEVPVVQVVAVRLLNKLGSSGEIWAREIGENLQLEPEVEEWVTAASF
jgi:protein PhnA